MFFVENIFEITDPNVYDSINFKKIMPNKSNCSVDISMSTKGGKRIRVFAKSKKFGKGKNVANKKVSLHITH